MSAKIYFNKVSRQIYNNEELKQLPTACKWLYTVLVENESRFADKNGWFFRSDKDLSEDAGISDKTMKKYKRLLKDKGLIDIGIMHFIDPNTEKKSRKKVTAYKILDI